MLKRLISDVPLRNQIAGKTCYSTFVNSVMDEYVEDAIVKPELTNFNFELDNPTTIMGILCAFALCLNVANMPNEPTLEKMETKLGIFVNMNDIKRKTKMVLIIIFFVLSRNLENAI